MRSRVIVVCFAVFASLFLTGAGCGGGECPTGSQRYELNKEDFVGVKEAQDGFACLTKDPALVSFPMLGTYEYDDFGTPGAPRVKLSSGDDSFFQKHGVTEQSIDWGIMLNPSTGKPVGVQTSNGAQLLFFYKLNDAGTTLCTPGLVCNPDNQMTYSDGVGEWDVANLTISFTKHEMYILGERIKSCTADSALNGGIADCTYVKDFIPEYMAP